MSRTINVNPLLVLLAILVGTSMEPPDDAPQAASDP
jgi:hypothetical protein